ncbi:MAG: serine/threonine protein phosphatase [Rhodobacterales bacterium]|nr:serine/threonine protein phosphatase [Rhodobacterales bacterium]
MGNHEKMMLDFLDAPEDRGNMWLRNGGLQTLASYGIGGLTDHAKPAQLVKTRDALRAALPEHCEDWLRKLPMYWTSGNIVCVHAGMNPNIAIDAQDSRNCVWGHRDFLKNPRQDGNWIVYGHIISEQAEARDGRISIDTGAYYSGRLSAAVIDRDSLGFLTT